MAPKPAVALFLFLLAPPATDELASSYAAGDASVRIFETRAESRLSELAFVVDGEKQSPPELPVVTSDGTERIVVTEEVLEVRDGRPVRMRRTYDEIVFRQEISAPDGDLERERESAIEGQSVVFAWDEEDGEWSAEGDGAELDADLLVGLSTDLSLSVFLPAGEVAEGDSWDVPASAFAALFEPAGELSLESDDEEEDFDRRRTTADLLESIAGTITATYRGTREEDGTEVGVIELAVEVELEAQLGEEAGSVLRFTRDVSGEMLWNASRGRLHALELEGDAEETLTAEIDVEGPEGEARVESVRAFSGTISYRFHVE